MASPRMGAAGVNLPLPASIYNLISNRIALKAGGIYLLPSGSFNIGLGPYCHVQFKDPVSGLWRNFGTWPTKLVQVNSDGVNWRVVNVSGCMVGALMTNKGSGYTSAPTVTATGATLKAILSPSLSSVTVTTAGSGYTYPPIIVVAPPPSGGIQATCTATLSSDTVGSVTVVNEGAGYSGGIPTVTAFPDSRDPNINSITPCVLTGVLTATGTVKAVVVTDPGSPQTSVQSISFSGGGGSSAAATAIYAFTLTTFVATTGGTAYGNAQPFLLQSVGGIVAGSAANTNPDIEKGIFTPRQGWIHGTSTAGGAITATGAVIGDGGLFQAVPYLAPIAAGDTYPTAQAVATATVGGTTDSFWISPF